MGMFFGDKDNDGINDGINTHFSASPNNAFFDLSQKMAKLLSDFDLYKYETDKTIQSLSGKIENLEYEVDRLERRKLDNDSHSEWD